MRNGRCSRGGAQALAQRSRIVLACVEGLSNTDVAAREHVSLPTVGKWRKRFLEKRLDGLGDEPRPGGPRTIADEQVEQVIVATLERAPSNATHWSRARMASESGLSKSSVGRFWKAFRLQPHRTDEFKISNDPLFVNSPLHFSSRDQSSPAMVNRPAVCSSGQPRAVSRFSFARDDSTDERSHDRLEELIEARGREVCAVGEPNI